MDYEPQLRNVRCLYVIQPMMERSAITKFGIAGELYGNAYKRLRDYQIEYGDATEKNDCKGTWIYYCGITKYNPYVLPANTEVRKTETYLKRLFKSKLEKKRGTERVKVSPQKRFWSKSSTMKFLILCALISSYALVFHTFLL